MAKKVIVYSANWCAWCRAAIDFLKDHNIPFETKDVGQGGNAAESMSKSGQAGIPVIDIGGQIVIGFDVKKIKELLDIK